MKTLKTESYKNRKIIASVENGIYVVSAFIDGKLTGKAEFDNLADAQSCYAENVYNMYK